MKSSPKLYEQFQEAFQELNRRQQFDSLNGGNLCISSDGRFLYATNEVNNLTGKLGAGGGVLAFAINRDDGSLTHLNTQLSMGVDPCFIVIDPTGSRVLVANHGRGNPVARLSISIQRLVR